ncbi:MAG: hypothetical protein H6Q05_2407 [Acidobacteria bacterium]|nr:hypothetical protein [Acidobacteriota bacterium]
MHSVLRVISILVAAIGAPATLASSLLIPVDAETAAQKPGALRACSLLTPAEIKSILGDRTPRFFDQVPPNEETLSNGGTECFISTITIQLDAHPVAAFEETRKRYMASSRTKFEPISGVGDAAYFYEQDAGKQSHVAGIYTKVGQHVLTVSMDVITPATAESIRPGLLALTKAAATKLR